MAHLKSGRSSFHAAVFPGHWLVGESSESGREGGDFSLLCLDLHHTLSHFPPAVFQQLIIFWMDGLRAGCDVQIITVRVIDRSFIQLINNQLQ